MLYIDVVSTGKRLKKYRKSNRLTLRKVAEKIGLSSGVSIHKWEVGLSLPRVDNLCDLAKLYGVSMEDLLVFYGE